MSIQEELQELQEELQKLRACRSVEHAIRAAWRKKDEFSLCYDGNLAPIIKHESGLMRSHIRGLISALRILRNI